MSSPYDLRKRYKTIGTTSRLASSDFLGICGEYSIETKYCHAIQIVGDNSVTVESVCSSVRFDHLADEAAHAIDDGGATIFIRVRYHNPVARVGLFSQSDNKFLFSRLQTSHEDDGNAPSAALRTTEAADKIHGLATAFRKSHSAVATHR